MATAETSKEEAPGGDAEGDGEAAAAPSRKSRKKLLLIVVAVVLLLGLGGGAGWYFLLRMPPAEGKGAEKEAAEPVTAEELVDVAEMTVNLRTSDGAAKTLRVHLMLVPGDKNKEEITAALPLVLDAFQPFLRELRPEPPAAPGAGEGGGAFDQSAIDALFGDVDTAAPARTGLRALVENDSVRQERLPMLEVICDRVLRSFATAMRNLTSDTIDVSLDGVSSGRFGDLMNHAPLPAMFGVFRVPEWNDYGVIVVEPALIYTAVDALLGGGKAGERQQRIEGRAFTPIEIALVGKLMQLALDELASSFASLAAISMTVERIETSPRFAAISGPTTTTAVCTYGIEIEGKTGRFTVLLPYPCIEPVRDKLLQRFMGEKPGDRSGWGGQLESELRATPLDLGAVLADRELGLHDVSRWAVGDVVPLGVGPDDPLELLVEGVPLAAGLIGRKGSAAAVRLTSGWGPAA